MPNKNNNLNFYNVEGSGEFKFHEWPGETFWKTEYNATLSNPQLELIISVNDQTFPTYLQISKLKEVLSSFAELEEMLYNYISKSYSKAGEIFSVVELKKMYFISAVDVKSNNMEFWVVLEPFPEVENIYDHMIRFTISDMQITWSNLN